MKSMALALTVGLLFGTSLGFAKPGSGTPLLVLVHGANFSARSWKWVQADLARTGIQSIAPQLYAPTERVDLSTVSARLCDVLASVKSPVILVAHSQGGAVATQAAANCGGGVQAIVYVAAVIPAPGAGVFDQLSDADNDSYGKCGVLNQGSDTYDLKSLGACRAVFFADAPSSFSKVYFSTMESEPAGIGESKADYVPKQLSLIPKYYVETQQDLIVSPATQHKIVAQVALKAVFRINSSHTPFFREHAKLSEILEGIKNRVDDTR